MNAGAPPAGTVPKTPEFWDKALAPSFDAKSEPDAFPAGVAPKPSPPKPDPSPSAPEEAAEGKPPAQGRAPSDARAEMGPPAAQAAGVLDDAGASVRARITSSNFGSGAFSFASCAAFSASLPFFVTAVLSAPALRSARTISPCPMDAALMSAVMPLSSAMLTRFGLEVSIAFTSASLFISFTAAWSCSNVANVAVGAGNAGAAAAPTYVSFEPAVVGAAATRGVVCWDAAGGNAAAGAPAPAPKQSVDGWASFSRSPTIADCDLRAGDDDGAAAGCGHTAVSAAGTD